MRGPEASKGDAGAEREAGTDIVAVDVDPSVTGSLIFLVAGSSDVARFELQLDLRTPEGDALPRDEVEPEARLLHDVGLFLRSALRTTIFVPFIISMAVAALSFGFLLNAQTGILPYWVSKFGFTLPDILNSNWALPAVIFVAVWKNFGYFMVIFIGGLQTIPGDLYEAAEIDGANAWRRFVSVTLPGLRPTMTYVVILAANGAFQAFDQIYVMTGGGPLRSTETIVYRVYIEGFKNFRQGYASALSFILMAITMVIGVVQLIISRRQEKDLA